MASTHTHITDFAALPGGLTEDSSEWVFPTVHSVNAHGKQTEWTVRVRVQGPNSEFIPIEPEYIANARMAAGLRGWIKVDSRIAGGQIRASEPTHVRVGKNIGKASETNVLCQALRDALGLYNRQLKKANTAENQKLTVELFPPMLAQNINDLKTPLVVSAANPVHVQRKYNGVRVVTTYDNGRVIMYSRGRNLYPGLQYIKNELAEVLAKYYRENKQLYLDGEVYLHGAALQDISGDARKDGPTTTRYNYMIYDCFIANEPTLTYSARAEILADVFMNAFTYAKPVETVVVTDRAELDAEYNKYIIEGYEGAMIRLDTPYRYSYNDYHSRSLLKMKPSFDHEFEVVGYTTGTKGKAANALMIICVTSDGIQFPCTPKLTYPERIALATKMPQVEANGKTHFENHWKGKKIIVVFDEYSRDRVPLRARTELVVRSWD